MTTTSTIAGQVASLHRASAGQLPAEVTEAFAAEQRETSRRTRPPVRRGRARTGCQMANCSTSPASRHARRDPGRQARRHRVLPRRLVPLLQHRPAHLPGAARARSRRARHQPDRHQPADTGRIAVHEGVQGADLKAVLGPTSRKNPTGYGTSAI